MTAWDFSPEQREIIAQMIEAALDRRLGPAPEQGITLEPAGVVLNLGPPPAPPAFGAGVAAGSLEPQ